MHVYPSGSQPLRHNPGERNTAWKPNNLLPAAKRSNGNALPMTTASEPLRERRPLSS